MNYAVVCGMADIIVSTLACGCQQRQKQEHWGQLLSKP